MYTYIYDTILGDKKYFQELSKVESKITDLGLGGRVCRMSPLRNLRDAVNDEIKKYPDTLVVVGSDKLFTEVISLIGGGNIPLAYIPLGEASKLASNLGITTENAVSVLSARRIVKMGMGAVGARTFLWKIEIIGKDYGILIDEKYKIFPNISNKVEIVNNTISSLNLDEESSNAANKDLKLVVYNEVRSSIFRKETKEKDLTSVCFQNASIQGEAKVILDGFVEISMPGVITTMEKGLLLVVGKDREII